MPNQIANGTQKKNIIAECLVWACIGFAASFVLFFVGSLIQEICGYRCAILKIIFYPVGATTEYLVSKEIISSGNWPCGLLIGYAIPWMIVGGCFGFYRGISSNCSGMSRKTGCVVTSAIVVLTVLVLAASLFVLAS